MGNVLGYLGQGPRLIAYDAHVDTVGVGNPENWDFDPFEGFENEEIVGGRGSSDQRGGLAAMVWSAKIIRDLNLLPKDATLVMTGTVQEEDCDGLCWQYLIRQRGLRPEFVLSTEPTDGGLYRGQRGRMEMKVDVRGKSAHGSAPHRGDNAIFKMGRILRELEELGGRLADDPFLGKGTLTVSEIFFTAPSRCAVADGCWISVDRRLTRGEDKDQALKEIQDLPSVRAAGARVTLYSYNEPSYTGLVIPTECHFPVWTVPEDHPVLQAAGRAHQDLFGEPPRVDKWAFSTNGVSITGLYGIPCIGYGPGKEAQAHAPNEKTWKADLVRAAALYAALPQAYLEAVPVPPGV
jgi:putative selenium metabolism hydrolase